MTPPLMMRILCLTMFIGMFTACMSAPRGDPPTAQGRTQKGCRLSLTTLQTRYRFDETIPLTVGTSNASEKPAYVRETNAVAMYRFEVRLPDGKPAPLTLEGKRESSIGGSSSTITIRPNESHTVTIPMLNRLFDMTLLGQYKVRVFQNVWLHDNMDAPVELESNLIELTIDEKDSKNPSSKPSSMPVE